MDNKKDVEPGESGSGSKNQQMTTPAPPQVDDFGLPLKRFPTPENNDATTEDTSEKQDAPEKAGHITERSKERAAQSGDDTRQSDEPAEPNGTRDHGCDSDDADFKDAQSVIPSDTASASSSKSATSRSRPPTASDSTPSPHTQSGDQTTPMPTPNPAKHNEEIQNRILDGAETPRIGAEPTSKPSKEHFDRELPNSEQDVTPSSPTAKRHSQQPKISHSRDPSKASTLDGAGVSEFSHQPLPAQPEAEDESEDLGWQKMPAFARFDMYDDDDRLIAKELNEEDEDDTNGYSGLGGAGKGYTRVLMDEDAQSATSLDENTQYLFKEANGTSMAGQEEDEGRDAISQMQATKDLLTEGQRIAYVGVVRLEIATLVKDGEILGVSRKTRKEATAAAESLKMWGQKMMIRLYGHMDISEAEQVMIEQLAEHGVMPQDLTPALLANSRVQNPMADDLDAKEPKTEDQKAEDKKVEDMTLDELDSLPSSPISEKTAEMPPPYESLEGTDMPEVKTPSQLPTTEKIDIDLRWTVLCDLFLVLIADSIYDARSRVLLERVGTSLDIAWMDICRFEKRVTDALEMQQAAEKENWDEGGHMESRRKQDLTRRYVMMGLATVGGGLVIGLSAGLLAPVIGAGLAAGFTTIGVTGTSSFLAGAGGAAIITSGAAASGSLIGGRAANRRTGAVKTFEYRPLHNKKRVNLVVTVSGWLTGKVDDVRLPFSTVDPIMGDIYSVLWEPEMLRSMGDTINILATEALTQGLQQILGSTILVSLMAALQLPIVLTKLSYLIDNPWAVSLDRAVSAGQILADSLLERSLGTRPITLVGYSLGSRVIFSCLQELAKRGAYGIVQNVYMFGSPVVVKKEEYIRARTVVAGRFVNGYNRNDWILGYLFRLTNGGIRRVAGLAPLDDCPWIENIDVSELVPGHMEYRKAMPKLLMKCGWQVESEEFTEIEDPDPDNHNERQRELINEIEEARKELEKEGKAKKGSKFGIFGRRKKAERQEWEVYEDSKGKAAAAQEGGKVEDQEGNNHGVLFDIDAIRAELAKEGHEGEPEELQVREIESTLPPMKLDISPLSSPSRPALHLRDSLRETKSADVLPIRSSNGAGLGYEPPSSYNRKPSSAYAPEPEEDEIQMTFDTSFDDSKDVERAKSTSDEGQSRPGIRTSQTLPNVTLTDPWGDPDDDDFGQEKEISMTFA